MAHDDIEPVRNDKVQEVPYETEASQGHPNEKKDGDHWVSDVQVVPADQYGEPEIEEKG